MGSVPGPTWHILTNGAFRSPSRNRLLDQSFLRSFHVGPDPLTGEPDLFFSEKG